MKFSIIIPVYEIVDYLRDALQSCICQEYGNYDIHIVDDGSSSSTRCKIKEIIDEYNIGEKKIYYHPIINGGAAAARNHAASISDSDYLVFLDADDLLHAQALVFYEKIIEQTQCTLLCPKRFEFTNIKDIVTFQKHIDFSKINYETSANYYLNKINFRFGASNIVVSKKDFIQVNGFSLRTSKTSHAEDHDLLLKMGNYPTFVFLETPILVYYRLHDKNSVLNISKIAYGILRLMDSHQRGQYPDSNLYNKQIMEIIGVSVVHCIKRLVRQGAIKLSIEMFLKSYKYIYRYIISKMRPNGKRKSI